MEESRRLVTVALILAVLVGLFVGVERYREYNQKQRWIEQLVADFNDPAAAQFRNLKQSYRALCGEVNGKNRLGAYVGFKRFYSSNTGSRIEPDEDASLDPESSEGIIAGSNRRTFKALYEANCSEL